MRTLQKNKKTLYYALYRGMTASVDEDGNRNGEFDVTYYGPTKTRMNISPAKGNAESDPFGIIEPYTHVMVTSNMKCPIDVNSVLWIGEAPEVGDAGEGMTIFGKLLTNKMQWYATSADEGYVVALGATTPYNYVVLAKAESLNSISYAIRKVDVSLEAHYGE